MDEGLTRVAERIARAMAQAGMTRTQLAQAAGLDNKTLQSAVEGKRRSSDKTRRAIEGALGMDAGELDSAELGADADRGDDLTDADLIALVAQRFGSLRRENDDLRAQLKRYGPISEELDDRITADAATGPSRPVSDQVGVSPFDRRSAPRQPDPETEASQQAPGDGGYWLADKQLPDDLPAAAAEGHGGDEDPVRRAKRELDEAGEESQEPGDSDER